jgi:hypothetical protein
MLRAKHRVGGIQCPTKSLRCLGVPSLIEKEHPRLFSTVNPFTVSGTILSRRKFASKFSLSGIHLPL